MSITEPIGYLASALVLATFCMRDMAALRWSAVASNLAFIAYGALADLGPVLVLHLLLLPLNLARLREASVAARQRAPANRATPAEPELHVTTVASGAATTGMATAHRSLHVTAPNHDAGCACTEIRVHLERRNTRAQS
jgi:hypothetical protein